MRYFKGLSEKEAEEVVMTPADVLLKATRRAGMVGEFIFKINCNGNLIATHKWDGYCWCVINPTDAIKGIRPE